MPWFSKVHTPDRCYTWMCSCWAKYSYILHSIPCFFNKYAATEESTPPDIPTTTFFAIVYLFSRHKKIMRNPFLWASHNISCLYLFCNRLGCGIIDLTCRIIVCIHAWLVVSIGFLRLTLRITLDHTCLNRGLITKSACRMEQGFYRVHIGFLKCCLWRTWSGSTLLLYSYYCVSISVYWHVHHMGILRIGLVLSLLIGIVMVG